MKKTGLSSLIRMLFPLFLCATQAFGAEDFFAPLKDRLLQDGISSYQISQTYPHDLSPLFKTVSRTLQVRESKLNYAQFLYPSAISEAQEFFWNHEALFTKAETDYGVDRFVLVSIFLVETRLGRYTGNTSTLAVLSTFALMEYEEYRDRIWKLLPVKDQRRWGRSGFDQKLRDRSRWAYEELLAFLEWTKDRQELARYIQGSVMGAIGWPQFLPSSLMRYGVDGNKDGRIDLFQPADAIFSAANYLRAFGWPEAKTRADQEKVIYNYNHSRPYVQTILEAADRLRWQTFGTAVFSPDARKES